MGSRAFLKVTGDNPSRKKLPFLRQAGEKVPIWSLMGKFIGQDLTKISLPVILSEPLSTLQKCAESLNIQEHLIAKAAQNPDSLRRMALVLAHQFSAFNLMKLRTKKPFNPMLGETYELVTEDYRFFSEQVSHHPPISAFI
jgi:oxysterol-binding protein 1